jgi:hypothetical protein
VGRLLSIPLSNRSKSKLTLAIILRRTATQKFATEPFFVKMKTDLFASCGIIRWQIENIVMKLATLFLALPLVLGSGGVMAAT